jgi:hypothetical protein
VDYVKQHAKALAALAAAILAAIVPALYSDAPLGFAGWVNVIILAAGAVQIFNAANLAGYEYAKLIAAVATAGAVVLSSALSDGDVTRIEWIQVFVSALGAFTVYRLPNAQKPGKHEAPETVTDDYPRPSGEAAL